MKSINFNWDNYWVDSEFARCNKQLPVGIDIHRRYGGMMSDKNRVIRNDYRY